MTRVKRGTIKNKSRKNILKQTKGFRFARKSKKSAAKEALKKAGQHAFAHRKDKKAVARRLWQTRINAAVRPLGFSYSKFIDALKKKNIEIDRKILSEIAKTDPQSFERIVNNLK